MDCSIKPIFLNYILYVCNAVFAIIGFLFAVVGIFMIKTIGDFTRYPNAADIKTLPTLITVLGIVIVAVAIVGSFGVYAENTVFLTIYAGVTFVLFVLQVSLVFWTFLNISKYPNSMGDLVTMAWLHNTPQNAYPMDILQMQFNCCGRYGSSDYFGAGLQVPNSCCGDWIVIECPDKVYLTKPGCGREFYSFWRNNINIIRFSGIVLIPVQFIALIVTYYIVQTLRNSNCVQIY